MNPYFKLTTIISIVMNCGVVLAQGNSSSSEFDRFVHRGHQAKAWATLDPSALADSVLQTLEAERVIGREDPNLPATQIFQLTLRMALEKNDTETVQRLERGAEQANRQDLAAQVIAAQKTAGKARTLDPALQIPLDQCDIQTLAVYEAFRHDIQSAKFSGDARLIRDVLEDLDQLPSFPVPFLSSLKQEATDAIEGMEATPELPVALDRLVDNSRGIRWQWQGVKSGLQATPDTNVSHLGVEPDPTQPDRPRPQRPVEQLGRQRAGQSTNSSSGSMSYETRQAALQLLRNPNSIKPSFARPTPQRRP
jgi:hypothetical protein